MANNVFANGRELSCKSGSGKSIACFPDVCMTPPENPATPPGVPVPYPNTGSTSDCTSGSRSVKISGKECMLKNKSYFKKSMGDEAGSAAKKGVVSSKNRGKVYFTAWSMDVKCEGENCVRHLDPTTHNHGSPTNTGPWPFVDSMNVATGPNPCEAERAREKEACGKEGIFDEDGNYDRDAFEALCEKQGLKDKVTGGRDKAYSAAQSGPLANQPGGSMKDVRDRIMNDEEPDATFTNNEAAMEAWDAAEDNECLSARKCRLVPYGNSGTQTEEQKNAGNACCPGQTGHHLVDAAFFEDPSTTENANYSRAKAPTVCAAGGARSGSHGALHAHMKKFVMKKCGDDFAESAELPYTDVRDQAVKGVADVFPKSGCSPECMKAQLDDYHAGAEDENGQRKGGVEGFDPNGNLNVGRSARTGRGKMKKLITGMNDFIQKRKAGF